LLSPVLLNIGSVMTLFEPGLLKPPGRLLRQGRCEPRSVTERIFSIASDKAISNGVLGL
jgi:hypothetical protein